MGRSKMYLQLSDWIANILTVNLAVRDELLHRSIILLISLLFMNNDKCMKVKIVVKKERQVVILGSKAYKRELYIGYNVANGSSFASILLLDISIVVAKN